MLQQVRTNKTKRKKPDIQNIVSILEKYGFDKSKLQIDEKRKIVAVEDVIMFIWDAKDFEQTVSFSYAFSTLQTAMFMDFLHKNKFDFCLIKCFFLNNGELFFGDEALKKYNKKVSERIIKSYVERKSMDHIWDSVKGGTVH